jgi:hypothetical protein
MNEKINNILSEYSEIVKEKLKIRMSDPESSMVKIWFEIADKIIDQVNIEDLYIDINPNDIETLKFFREKKLDNRSNSEIVSDYLAENVYLNDFYAEKVCLNIKKLSFYSLYPTILIKLVDNNIIKMDKNYYTVFKYFVKNRGKFRENMDNYIVVRMFINYFYGIIYGDTKYKTIKKLNCENFHNFEYYKFFLYNNIKKQLNNDLIYFDIDEFYYKGDHQFNFDIPYEIENVDEFVIFKKKKYIEKITNTNKYRGFKYLLNSI